MVCVGASLASLFSSVPPPGELGALVVCSRLAVGVLGFALKASLEVVLFLVSTSV